MTETDFINMSRENLRQLIADLEAENKQNWLGWFEDPITRTDNQNR